MAPARRRHGAAAPAVARAALVRLAHTHLCALGEPELTLPDVHKLAYFLQLAGLPMRLHFVRGAYGPRALGLARLLRASHADGLICHAAGRRKRLAIVELAPGAQEAAGQVLAAEDAALAALGRAAALIEGFETSFGLGLLAVTHWAAAQEGATTAAAVAATLRNWGARVPVFTLRQIELALARVEDASRQWAEAGAGSGWRIAGRVAC